MATVLSIVQEAASGLKQLSPQLVVGNDDKLVAEMLVCFNHVGWLLRRRYEWPILVRTATVTLESGQPSYALPADFGRAINRTHWDQGNHWELVGPLTPQEWQYLKQGRLGNIGPRRTFRVMGQAGTKFNVFPVPGADDTGKILSFEYISENWVLPKIWAANTAVSFGEYRSYDGNIYTCSVMGTTSTTPPTHTTGTVSDGTAGWTYYSGLYDRPLADTDTPVFDSRLMSLGVEAVWLQRNGMDFAPRMDEWQREVARELTRYTGARTLSIASGSGGDDLVNYSNIPDSGYG